MNLKNLRIRNFRCIEGAELEIPSPGLYLISGVNEADSDVGSNGAGKSTILDAFHWALTGQSVRGISGPSLEPWEGGKDVRVELDADIPVVRERNPNQIFLDGKKCAKEILEERYWQIPIIAIHGQFEETFFDLTSERRMKLLDRVAGLERWKLRAARARELSSTHDFASKRLSGIIYSCEDRMRELQERLAEVSCEQQDKGTEVQVEKLQKELKQLEEERSEVHEELMEAKAEKAWQSVEEVKAELKVLEERGKKLWEEMVKEEQKFRILREEVEALSESKEDFDCPTCYQVATYGSDSFEVLLCKKQEEYRHQSIEYNEISLKHNKLREEKEALQEKYENLKDTAHKADSKARRLNSRYKEIISLRDSREQRKEFLLKDANLAKGIIDSLKDGLERERERCKDAESEMNLQIEAFDMCQVWDSGFKKIRLQVAEQAAETVEQLANLHLADLGLDGWSVSCEAEKITKAGTISRKFHIFVSSPLSPNEVPSLAWSGGEGQRLRLAFSMALSDLASLSSPEDSNVEFFDEPTQHLSGEGVESVLQCLAKRAKDKNRAIFIIEHRSLEWPFDGEYLVRKDGQGHSRLESAV